MPGVGHTRSVCWIGTLRYGIRVWAAWVALHGVPEIKFGTESHGTVMGTASSMLWGDDVFHGKPVIGH